MAMHLERFNSRILVVGDVILDRYDYGSVSRISPEAPVPVFRPGRVCEMPGGAGNVALNLVALGCKVGIVARVGADPAGKSLSSLLSRSGVAVRFLRQKGCVTTVKTRLVVGNSQLVRIDEETLTEISCEMEDRVASAVRASLGQVDVVMLSDYGKGFLSKRLCQSLIRCCQERGVPVVVDPKGTNYEKYAGSLLVKPNLKELEVACGVTFEKSSGSFKDDVTLAAKSLIRRCRFGGLLVTLSEMGMVYVPAGRGKSIHIPTLAREVFDVSGAGDTSIAALGASIGMGYDMKTAMRIANVAAGIVVGKLGTATVSLRELQDALTDQDRSFPVAKILTAKDIVRELKPLRSIGKKIGFTNGCFDCCHLGHLHSICEAKHLCDVLVVGVNSDDWIRRHKGPNRPVQDEATRTALLASLEYVDYVVVFGDETALPLVRAIRPDVIAKEGYALDAWPEGRFVNAYGGRAVVLDRVAGYSTTGLVGRMRG